MRDEMLQVYSLCYLAVYLILIAFVILSVKTENIFILAGSVLLMLFAPVAMSTVMRIERKYF